MFGSWIAMIRNCSAFFLMVQVFAVFQSLKIANTRWSMPLKDCSYPGKRMF